MTAGMITESAPQLSSAAPRDVRSPSDGIVDIFMASNSEEECAADLCADSSDCDWEPFCGTLWSDSEAETPLGGRTRKSVTPGRDGLDGLWFSRGCVDVSSDQGSGASTVLYGGGPSDDGSSDHIAACVASGALSDESSTPSPVFGSLRDASPAWARRALTLSGDGPILDHACVAPSPFACEVCDARCFRGSVTCLECGIGKCMRCSKDRSRFFCACDASGDMRCESMSEEWGYDGHEGVEGDVDADASAYDGDVVAPDAVFSVRADASQLAAGQCGGKRRASAFDVPQTKRMRRACRDTRAVDQRISALISRCARDYAEDWRDPGASAALSRHLRVRRRRYTLPWWSFAMPGSARGRDALGGHGAVVARLSRPW